MERDGAGSASRKFASRRTGFRNRVSVNERAEN